MLKNWFISLGMSMLEELKPAIVKAAKDAIEEYLPKITEVVVTSIVQSAGQLTVDTTDRITDIIPGRVDDDIIDPIVTNIFERLGIRR